MLKLLAGNPIYLGENIEAAAVMDLSTLSCWTPAAVRRSAAPLVGAASLRAVWER